ncbi:MAG: DNA polymerase I [Deltaproteobacteria bacterium]|nr:DNA polymerase I [Deltaproteobacteria bacterium]
MKPLYIIDATSYIYRAFFAIRRLSTSDGRPTNAIYGFISMLSRVYKDFDPERVCLVFDAKEKTFRHKMYPAYKATRSAPPEGLVEQIPAVHEIAKAFCVPVLSVPGFEADDVIGTLAAREAAAGRECVIITGDKDLMQLVSDRVTLYDTMKEQRTDTAGVRARFGVGPAHVADVLALAGDSSDNIPGVRGVGEKTATGLVSRYGRVEEIYADLSRVENVKLREKLEASREDALLSKKLATIVTDVPLDLAEDALAARPPDRERIEEILRRFEITKVPLPGPARAPEGPRAAGADSAEKKIRALAERDYVTVLDMQALGEALAAVRAAEIVSIDTETTSVEPVRAALVGVSLGVGGGRAFYIPIAHLGLDAPRQLRWEDVRGPLAEALDKKALAAQNAKYDLIVLSRHGLPLKIGDDTMIVSYLLDPEAQSHGLRALARLYLSYDILSFDEVVGKRQKEGAFADLPVDIASRYSCEDADVTHRLRDALLPKLTGPLLALYREVEMPLVPILARMEMAGMRVDPKRLEALSAELGASMKRTAEEIFAAAGTEFNIGSPRQLADVLFNRLGLRTVKNTKTGPSTDSEVLEELAAEHELPGKVLAYRSFQKLKDTYLDAFPALVNRKTGRIHCSFNQTVTATGRLSSSQPNLQNIPIRTPIGRMIREAFCAPDGRTLISADYSQIELRVLAHLSGDKTLLRAFENGEDIHARTASEVFGVEIGRVTSDQRRAAKTINFGIVYGMGAFRLARELGIKRTEAQEYIDSYFARIPGVRRYLDSIISNARAEGSVKTITGRVRYVPNLNSRNPQARQGAERVATNTPIQGSAADIMKLSMIRLDGTVSRKADLLLQVHDELVFEVDAQDAGTLAAEIRKTMETAVLLSVPLKVDVGTGKTWADAH